MGGTEPHYRTGERFGSFKVSMTTGQWSNVATTERGGDPVSPNAYVRHAGQPEAGRALAEVVGSSNQLLEKRITGAPARPLLTRPLQGSVGTQDSDSRRRALAA